MNGYTCVVESLDLSMTKLTVIIRNKSNYPTVKENVFTNVKIKW